MKTYVLRLLSQYLKKGSRRFIVEGQLQTRKWQDDKGNDRYSTEVVIKNFDGRLTLWSSGSRSDGAMDHLQVSNNEYSQEPPADSAAPSGGDLDDEIPF